VSYQNVRRSRVRHGACVGARDAVGSTRHRGSSASMSSCGRARSRAAALGSAGASPEEWTGDSRCVRTCPYGAACTPPPTSTGGGHPMSSAEIATELRFEPPGPGSWDLDPVHFPRPATRYWTETHPEAFKRGVSDFTRFYGMLLDTLEMEYVNGFAYKTAWPVAEGEVPGRIARAGELFEGRLWREQLREWDDEVKPASISTHRELQSVDPDALGDEELVAYLRR